MVEKLEFLLYKLEEPLKRIEKRELKKPEEKEKYIQDLFSENLSSISSNLIFLAKECELESISGERGAHRLDTLAFDKDRKCFVIIEYKNKPASELASQIKTYLDCLNNIDNQYTLLRHLNNRLKKDFHRTEIEWEETKGICIVTEIDGRASWADKDKNVKIIEIKFFYNYNIRHRKEKHQGTGDWHFPPIKIKDDFRKLKNFFKRGIHQEYKENFSENSEAFQ